MNSREIIHQFVNIARHPEAKDLEEALEMEKLIDGCKILAKLKSASYVKNLYAPIEEQEYMEFIVNNSGLSTTGAYGTSLFDTDDSIELCNVVILGRPITAFDVCWALNKKQSEFNFSVDTRGISFSRVCTMEVDGNLVSCMPSLQGSKKGIFSFKTIEEDGTHTTPDQWGSKICNNLAILMYSNKDIIEIAKFKPKVK